MMFTLRDRTSMQFIFFRSAKDEIYSQCQNYHKNKIQARYADFCFVWKLTSVKIWSLLSYTIKILAITDFSFKCTWLKWKHGFIIVFLVLNDYIVIRCDRQFDAVGRSSREAVLIALSNNIFYTIVHCYVLSSCSCD